MNLEKAKGYIVFTDGQLRSSVYVMQDNLFDKIVRLYIKYKYQKSTQK